MQLQSKKQLSKRLISLALTFVMMLALLPVFSLTASAAGPDRSRQFIIMDNKGGAFFEPMKGSARPPQDRYFVFRRFGGLWVDNSSIHYPISGLRNSTRLGYSATWNTGLTTIEAKTYHHYSHWYGSDGKVYKSGTLDGVDCTAWFDDKNGELHLWNYNGGGIGPINYLKNIDALSEMYVEGYLDNRASISALNIVLHGENTITVDQPYGAASRLDGLESDPNIFGEWRQAISPYSDYVSDIYGLLNVGDINITGTGSLEIMVNAPNLYKYNDSIPTIHADTKGKIWSGYTIGANEIRDYAAYGIRSLEGNVRISAPVNISVSSSYKAYGIAADSYVVATSDISIYATTTKAGDPARHEAIGIKAHSIGIGRSIPLYPGATPQNELYITCEGANTAFPLLATGNSINVYETSETILRWKYAKNPADKRWYNDVSTINGQWVNSLDIREGSDIYARKQSQGFAFTEYTIRYRKGEPMYHVRTVGTSYASDQDFKRLYQADYDDEDDTFYLYQGDLLIVAAEKHADPNMVFDKWTITSTGAMPTQLGGGALRLNSSALTFNMVDANLVFTPSYKVKYPGGIPVYVSGDVRTGSEPYADVATAMIGETVTITAPPPTVKGWVFSNWTVSTFGVTLDKPNSTVTSFVMPSTVDVRIRANYTQVQLYHEKIEATVTMPVAGGTGMVFTATLPDNADYSVFSNYIRYAVTGEMVGFDAYRPGVEYILELGIEPKTAWGPDYKFDSLDKMDIKINGVKPDNMRFGYNVKRPMAESYVAQVLWIPIRFTIPGALEPMKVNYTPSATHIPGGEVGAVRGQMLNLFQFASPVTVSGGSGRVRVEVLDFIETPGGTIPGGAPAWLTIIGYNLVDTLYYGLTTEKEVPHSFYPEIMVPGFTLPNTPYAAQKLPLRVVDVITGEEQFITLNIGAVNDTSGALQFVFDWKYQVPGDEVNKPIPMPGINLLAGARGGAGSYNISFAASSHPWLRLNNGVLSGTRPPTTQFESIVLMRLADGAGDNILFPLYVGGVWDSAAGIAKGDVTGTGTSDIFDLLAIIDHINGKTVLSGDALFAADVNGDGVVDIFDLLLILDHINGKAPLW